MGKSSLLNALLSKPLARTSNTPVRLLRFRVVRTLSCRVVSRRVGALALQTCIVQGRTQTINYYQAGNVKLVDLPGTIILYFFFFFRFAVTDPTNQLPPPTSCAKATATPRRRCAWSENGSSS